MGPITSSWRNYTPRGNGPRLSRVDCGTGLRLCAPPIWTNSASGTRCWPKQFDLLLLVRIAFGKELLTVAPVKAIPTGGQQMNSISLTCFGVGDGWPSAQ